LTISKPMQDDLEGPLYGPPVSAEWLREKREQLVAEEDDAERAELADFVAGIKAKADAEILRWSALPCSGDVAFVTRCSDAVAKICQERDHIMCPRNQLARLMAERQWQREEKRKALLEAGITERVLRAVYDAEPVETEALRLLREVLAMQPSPQTVVLKGGVGVGKSCAAAWWAIQRSAHWITAEAMARISPYDADSARLRSVNRLVIDDLGTEYADSKGFFLSHLDAVIDARYANELQTLITTNVDAATFKQRYGQRIADRIREAGKFVTVAGGSMRRAS